MLITGYRLKHPNSNRHYIGITSQDCQDRLIGHLNDKENNKRTAWIKSHQDERQLFYMEPFFVVDDWSLAKDLEVYWIAEDRKIYGKDNIMNGTDGGDGTPGHITNEETKKKLSTAKSGENNPNFGKPLKPETRVKISIAAKKRTPRTGWKHSPETKIKMSNASKGKQKSETSKQKMSIAKKGKPSSRKGIQNSDDANNRISKGKSQFGPEQINAILDMIRNGIPQVEIAKNYKVSPATISMIKNGRLKFYSSLRG